MKSLIKAMSFLLLVLTVAFPSSLAWAVKPVTFGFTSVPGMKIGTTRMTWSSGQRSLASYGQNLYAGWSEQVKIGAQYYYLVRVATSTDDGLTWGPSITVDALSTNIQEVIVAVSDNNGSPVLHVVWGAGPNISYANSTDNGVHFSAPQILTSAGTSYSASLAAHGSYVHVAYYNYAANSVEYIRSTDYGATWNTPQVMETGDNTDEPMIAANALGKVYISWWNRATGQEELKLRVSMDNGSNWGSVSQHLGSYDWISMAVDNTSRVYIAAPSYDSGTGTWSLGCIYSLNDGASWSETNIPIDPNSLDTSIAVDPSGNPNIAFLGQASPGAPWYLYFARSTDFGASFTTTQLDDGSGDEPNLAMDDNGKANIFWQKSVSASNMDVVYFTKEQ